MLELTPEGQAIFRYLVGAAARVRPGRPGTYPTYGEVHADLRLPGTARDLEFMGLAELANAIYAADLPAITGLVVRQDTLMPGKGYFLLYEREAEDFQWWQAEIVRVQTFDWTPHLDNPSPPESPKASDLKKPDRVETTAYRILRDTLLARRVKQLNGYRCQICGETIILSDGTAYAEAHHVHPLGKDGPDVMENILCLCPNHHVELDYLARPIDIVTLRQVEGHKVGLEYILYHNKRVRPR